MRKALWFLVLLVFTAGFVVARGTCDEEGPTFEFKFKGSSIGLSLLDVAPLNPVLRANGFAPLSGRLKLGGEIDFSFAIGRLHFGLDKWSLTAKTEQGEKKVELSISSKGFDIGCVVASDQCSIFSIGSVFGRGEVELKLRHGVPQSFEEAVANPFRSVLETSFYAVEPYVSVLLQPLRWIGIRLQVGYLFAFSSPTWKVDRFEFPGPPFAPDGLSIGLSFAFGKNIERCYGDEEEVVEETTAP